MTENATNDKQILVDLTADIVSAHVSNNSVGVEELPALISSVFGALSGLGTDATPEQAPPEPAVSIRASVKPDHLVCLEDGKKLKMLKRHLATHYNLTPEQYRARWSLPSDYPMVAPNYAEKRRTLAKSIGLGRKPKEAKAPEATVAEAPAPKAKPGRKPSAKKAAEAA